MTINGASKPKGEFDQRQRDEDTEQIRRLEEAIVRGVGGHARMKKAVPLLLRQAINDVIDFPRTGRSKLEETKINERIYLATKIKVRLRHFLKLQRGRALDAFAAGAEAGIQSTIRQTWDIPLAIVGHPCLLVKTDVARAVCSLGTVLIRDEVLTATGKASRRRAISQAGLASVHWILENEPLPDIPY